MMFKKELSEKEKLFIDNRVKEEIKNLVSNLSDKLTIRDVEMAFNFGLRLGAGLNVELGRMNE